MALESLEIPCPRGRPPLLSRNEILSLDNRIVHQLHRQFQSDYKCDMSFNEFKGLCAYLWALLQWEYQIPASDFDSFVFEYARFKNLQDRNISLSYHQWFSEWKTESQNLTRSVLNEMALESMRDELPYTFELTSERLRIIAQKNNLTNQKSPEAHPRLDNQHRKVWRKMSYDSSLVESQGRRPEFTQIPIASSVDNPTLGSQGWNISFSQDNNNNDEMHSSERPWHSEKELRDCLGVRSRQEFLMWLKQHWVLDVYDEYCVSELDIRRRDEEMLFREGQSVPPARKRLSSTFLINTAVGALHCLRSRYSQYPVEKNNWMPEDHDIRFLTRIVQEGRRSGRWWEYRQQEQDTMFLCKIAYRLLCWLRYTHRISSATSQSTQAQRAVASEWHSQLSAARSLFLARRN